MFETKLGVMASKLEGAVRHCFASKFDQRVFRYMATNHNAVGDHVQNKIDPKGKGGFALVVMEMVDASVAGVAFSANPLNSDRDECVIDSSFGLGECIVDGSVSADRFVYDKIHDKLIDVFISEKRVERRLNLASEGERGGVGTIPIDDEARQKSRSLSDEQVKELVRLTCIVEKEYGTPMDVEWCVNRNNSQLVLLQARPITTLFCIDDNMMTEPGEKRVLYYDYNIVADATTTKPFTHMDMSIYFRASNVIMRVPENVETFKYDPNMPLFNASTRQYVNMSIFLKYLSTEYCSKEAILLDPYLASLFTSKDCDRDEYRMKKLPKGVNLRNLVWLCRQIPLRSLYKTGKRYKKDPKKAKEAYIKIVENDMANLRELEAQGFSKEDGLQEYSTKLFRCLIPSMNEEGGLLFFGVLQMFKNLDKQRREGKTEDIRSEYNALCGGYEGDELMAMNIDMYHLANKLDTSIWEQYEHNNLRQLAERIQKNLDGTISDLSPEFQSEWKTFMDRHGHDSEDQMFISTPCYRDDPVLLLTRLRQNAGTSIKDLKITQQEQVSKRKQVMKLHEDRAKSKRFTRPRGRSRIKKRNAIIEHLMWIRNAPKLHLSRMLGILRANVLQAEEDLIQSNRLEIKNDVFHLDLEEIDRAFADDSYDLMSLVRPRKMVYERALRAKECPLLFDSRCRILRPDPPSKEDIEDGVLIGAAVSPGNATGRVRIMKSPNDQFEQGEVLAATVTSPAWTPLFIGASAVILHIGGMLQHGALCAREFGKPAVSNINVHEMLKTGMMVEVDGNTGIVKVLDDCNAEI